MIVSHPSGPFDPEWPSLERYRVPEWYRDAKFGIFIHWGVYAVPAFANEWYPRNMYKQGTREFEHHVATYGSQASFGYKDFVPRFQAERFDPDAWAELFREAGARYVVPVAEHHDGFAMYETRLSQWNAKAMGPCRDVVGELGRAVRDRGMAFGVSSHRAEHWWFLNGGREFPSDVQDAAYADFYGPAAPEETQPDAAFLEDWLARCCELVDKFRPQVFWFDWWIEQPAFRPYLQRFAAYYYNRAAEWGVGVAINYKNEAYPVKAAVFDVERGQLEETREHFWQTDTAVAKNSWSHVDGLEYKTADSMVHDLVDIVSKNGCLLLNIGPRADGTIPEEDAAILRTIGSWLATNGEAVYATRPWTVYGEGPTRVVGGSFHDTDRAPFTGEDMRFTTQGGNLFVTLFGRPEGSVLVRSLGRTMRLAARPVVAVESLASNETLPFEQTDDGLRFPFPALPAAPAYAFRVRFAEG
ncbi:MAG: alpha-L-fucosidase [Fimbriimonadaceae bacterium]|nr:alpha-L-fucosidase [Fimbriimonadaceae bacterium]